jgi:hypothetical protein
MRALSIVALILSTATSVLAQNAVCIQAIQTTMSYQAALKIHATDDAAFQGRPCPTIVAKGKTVEYFLAPNSAGCCAQTASAHTLGAKAAACCPCGAECHGFFPKEMDWTVANGELTS